ncbi:hypothetical protein D3C79_462260 [compost metagenome]
MQQDDLGLWRNGFGQLDGAQRCGRKINRNQHGAVRVARRLLDHQQRAGHAVEHFLHSRAQQQATRHALPLRATYQQVAVFVLHHPGDFRDHRAGRDLHASGNVIALEQQGGQCLDFFACCLQHALQHVVIGHHQLLEALERGWIGNVEQVQRGCLRLAQQCSALRGVARSGGQIGGYQYVVQRAHVGLLKQCCAQ